MVTMHSRSENRDLGPSTPHSVFHQKATPFNDKTIPCESIIHASMVLRPLI